MTHHLPTDPPKVPPVTDLGFQNEDSGDRIEPSAQVDQKGYLKVYPRVGGFGKPVQDECVRWWLGPSLDTTTSEQQQAE